MNSPAEIIQALLVNLGLGTDPDNTPGGLWPIFIAIEPASPDDLIVINDTSPQYDGRSGPTKQSFQHYGVQIYVRAVDFPTGNLQALAIKVACETQVNQTNVVIGSYTYLVPALCKFQILRPGFDTPTSKRFVFTMNPTSAIIRIA
jgi:hypothetical protein